MTRRGQIVTGSILLVFLSFFLLLWISVLMNISGTEGLGFASDKEAVGVVDVFGVIYASEPVVKQIKYLRDDEEVAGLLIRVNSPGGGVAASEEIYHEIRRTRESGIPVVVSMGTVAASGGYYLSMGADTVMANAGTTTGSIGVIIELSNWQELFQKIGIEVNTIKSGQYKDSGSPHRALTATDRVYFQSLIDEFYDQFVQVVMQERGLSRDAVLAVADGRVFSGRQALALGLVDTLGDYEDALDLVKQMAGLDEDAPVVRMRKRSLGWLSMVTDDAGALLRFIRPEPYFAYLWMW